MVIEVLFSYYVLIKNCFKSKNVLMLWDDNLWYVAVQWWHHHLKSCMTIVKNSLRAIILYSTLTMYCRTIEFINKIIIAWWDKFSSFPASSTPQHTAVYTVGFRLGRLDGVADRKLFLVVSYFLLLLNYWASPNLDTFVKNCFKSTYNSISRYIQVQRWSYPIISSNLLVIQ